MSLSIVFMEFQAMELNEWNCISWNQCFGRRLEAVRVTQQVRIKKVHSETPADVMAAKVIKKLGHYSVMCLELFS